MDDNPLNRRPQGSPAHPQPQAYGAPPHQAYGAPPYLPYGAPPHQPYQPYQPPGQYSSYDLYPVKEGSYGLGIVLGLLFSLIGFILVAIFGKDETKRGALHGFLIRIGLTVAFIMIAAMT